VIVRISGTGQFELDDSGVRELDRLDTELTEALQGNQAERFHQVLAQTIAYVRKQGSAVADERVVGSEVIIPPEDVSLEEAQQFFTDEGLMAPLPA
jgi:hypothetical protein